MQGFLDFLNALVGSDLWGGAGVLLRGAFLVACARVLWLLVRPEPPARTATGKRKKSGGRRKKPAVPPQYRLLVGTLVLAFTALMAHQALWQFLGGRQSDFVAFMQRHDRRAFNPAHRLQRGRILDRSDRILATSRRAADGRVERYYPLGAEACHVVGYADPVFGTTGIERAADLSLQGLGDEGWANAGRDLLGGERSLQGTDLHTTLDTRLQRAAAAGLGQRPGAVVALDPRNGDVLALVSTPGFDPHRLKEATFSAPGPYAPIFNRATQGRYPPGSSFKPLIALAALRTGHAGPLLCPAGGYTPVASLKPIRDYGYYAAQKKGQVFKGYGRLDIATAMAKSSNTYFAQVAVRSGPGALQETLRQAGFDRPVDIGTQPGYDWRVSPVAAPRFSDRDSYGMAQAGVGQGRVLVSPLLMARLTAAIAHDGVLVAPRLTPMTPLRVDGRLCTPGEAKKIQDMMRAVVTRGTGRAAALPGIAVAGKTGTAEHGGERPHAWFIGFAPVDDPRIAVCVLVEEGGFGSTAALPIARDVMALALQGGGS